MPSAGAVAPHVPHRRCAGCGTVRPQRELLRFHLDGETVLRDGPVRAPGRGAYTCDRACTETAIRRRGFPRAFRRAVRPGPDLLEWAVSG